MLLTVSPQKPLWRSGNKWRIQLGTLLQERLAHILHHEIEARKTLQRPPIHHQSEGYDDEGGKVKQNRSTMIEMTNSKEIIAE